MRNLLAVVVIISACGVQDVPRVTEPPEVALKREAQQTLTNVTQAIIAGDEEMFRSWYMPLPNEDKDQMVKILMETQREGLRTHYDDQSPQIIELRDDGGGNLSASVFVPRFNTMSPKRIYFHRDDTGKIFWTGVKPYPIGPNNQLRQGIYNCLYHPAIVFGGCEDYDVWNQENILTHAIRVQSETWETAPSGCPNGSNSCWYPSHSSPWWHTVVAGFNQRKTLICNVEGSQCVVNLIHPSYSTCNCATHTTTKGTGNWCAWIHAWGWDFWYPNTSGSINDLPQVGAPGSCPWS